MWTINVIGQPMFPIKVEQQFRDVNVPYDTKGSRINIKATPRERMNHSGVGNPFLVLIQTILRMPI